MTWDTAKEAFLNESEELLEDMESSLLRLEQSPGDTDLINAIFRAAHTIKGTGGVFGFEDVEHFTHRVESVLDRVRNGELDVDDDLVAVLLSCCDHMGILVGVAVADQVVDEQTRQQGDTLHQSLQAYLRTDDDQACTTIAGQPDERVIVENARAVETGNWHLSVRFGKDVLRQGMDPLSFLRYLSKLGDIVHVTTVAEDLPPLEQMDPESCYLGYEVDFASDAEKVDIEQVFEFVREDCTLNILPPSASIERYLELIEALPESDSLIGEILVRGGALTPSELEEALAIQRSSMAVNGNAQPQSIGDVVVEQGMVHKEVVEAAAEKQQRDRAGLQHNKTLRVDTDKLDQLVNLVGELVIAGAGTSLIAQQLGNNPLIESISVMARLVEEIRDSALQLRMVQIGETFNRFQRVVRDVSRELGKDIRLEISGGETELDKTVVEKIGDPLMHLVRNAMDHGIESAEQRVASGKPANGTLRLNAYHDSGSIVIEVGDDGGGLARDRIEAKALEKGLINDPQSMSDQEIFRLIFEPGFSTAAQVSNLSGRGVGMDVVKKNIAALRGTVDIESMAGKGTTVMIRLPLTLAIIDGFLVGVDDASYVVPLDMVFECVEMTDAERAETRHHNYINLRGEVLPLLRLRDFFRMEDDKNVRENIVVVQSGNAKAGLVVNELLGEHQTVIKPLGKLFRNVKGLSGTTILGSGEVAMILDVPGLVQRVSECEGQLMKPGKSESLRAVVH